MACLLPSAARNATQFLDESQKCAPSYIAAQVHIDCSRKEVVLQACLVRSQKVMVHVLQCTLSQRCPPVLSNMCLQATTPTQQLQ